MVHREADSLDYSDVRSPSAAAAAATDADADTDIAWAADAEGVAA